MYTHPTHAPPSSGSARTDNPASLENAHRRILELETSLREIHHRIKNQIQTVSGLLDMHAARAETPECAERLREAMGCLSGVAELHRQLSQDPGDVDCGRYFHCLAESLRKCRAVPESVTLEVHAPNTPMDPVLLSTAGLLATELVSNAVRHAFPGTRRGIVSVDLVPGRHTLTIIVQDNGVGLPRDLDPATGGNMGFDILRGTTRQWGGRMVMSSDGGGTTATLSLVLP